MSVAKATEVIAKINELLDCEYEAIFEVKEVTGFRIADSSKHFRMSKCKHYVDFGVLNGEMNAYMWGCPHEGRVFLKALEKHAKKNGWKLTILIVLSHRLEKILIDNGYSKKEVLYLGDVCEVWSKE